METLGSYAAMEHPEYNAQRVRLDAMALLRDACDGLEGLASQRGDTLAVELPDTPVEAVWDASLVRRMVSNLVAMPSCITRRGRISRCVRISRIPANGCASVFWMTGAALIRSSRAGV